MVKQISAAPVNMIKISWETFNSDGNLPLNKTLKLHNIMIFIRSVFEKHGKFYSQVYLDECLYEL